MRVVGTVTEIREMPQEIRVYLADDCGGAVLHLAVDASAPPVGSQIRVTALGSLRNLQIDLYVAPETRLESLPGTAQPQAIPFMQAMLQRALTGTRVRSAGTSRKLLAIQWMISMILLPAMSGLTLTRERSQLVLWFSTASSNGAKRRRCSAYTTSFPRKHAYLRSGRVFRTCE